MDKAREQAIWEHNLARVYNKAIHKAAWLVKGLTFDWNKHVVILSEKELLVMNNLLGSASTKELRTLRDKIHIALDDEDSTCAFTEAILGLEVPYYSDEAEAIFTRRNELQDKKDLSAEEKEEMKSLREQISRLPSGYSVEDQEARDSIREAAEMLRKYKD